MINRNNLMVTPQVTPQDTPQVQRRETAILSFCIVPRTREEIQNYIGIKDRSYFREKILKPLLASNKLSMTIPDKPNSKLQKYVKT